MSESVISIKFPPKHQAFFLCPGILGIVIFVIMTPIAMFGLLASIPTSQVQVLYFFLGIFLGLCSTIFIDLWGWFLPPRGYYKYFLTTSEQWLLKASWSILLLGITTWLFFQHAEPRSIFLVTTMLFVQFFTVFLGMIGSVSLTFRQRRIIEPRNRRKIWILVEEKKERDLNRIASILNISIKQVRYHVWELILAGQLRGHLTEKDEFIAFGSALDLYEEYLQKINEWPLERILMILNQRKNIPLIELARLLGTRKDLLKNILTTTEHDLSWELQGQHVILKEETDSATLQEQLRKILQQKIAEEKSKT